VAELCGSGWGGTVCKHRRNAIIAGEMLYDKASRKWVWPVSPFNLLKKIPRYGWTFCPFCGESL
jgi:hypothetical protein